MRSAHSETVSQGSGVSPRPRPGAAPRRRRRRDLVTERRSGAGRVPRDGRGHGPPEPSACAAVHSRSQAYSAAISAATRAGQFTQASRSSRASRKTSVPRGAVDQLAPSASGAGCALLRLQHLVRGLGLQEGRAAADRGRQTLSRGACRQRGDGRLGHGLQLRRRRPCGSLTGRSSRPAAGPKPRRRCCQSRARARAVRRLRLLDRAARQPDMGGVLALAHALHRRLRLSFKVSAYVVDKPGAASERPIHKDDATHHGATTMTTPPEPDHQPAPRTPRREGAPEQGSGPERLHRQEGRDRRDARPPAGAQRRPLQRQPRRGELGHVGSLGHYRRAAREITAIAFGEGEHAE
ncbi:MAG: hypothetical protein KatS3mg118_3366 [Paracoccaceae bacterium]|nr:MAG: hypothetical protein KatS3mg118_3366 [Paracoccaceae bacterium]